VEDEDDEDEDEEEEELEEDTLRLELELEGRERVSKTSEVGEGDGDELGTGGWLETDETELWLGSPPSPLVPLSMMFPRFCLLRSPDDRLRSILCSLS